MRHQANGLSLRFAAATFLPIARHLHHERPGRLSPLDWRGDGNPEHSWADPLLELFSITRAGTVWIRYPTLTLVYWPSQPSERARVNTTRMCRLLVIGHHNKLQDCTYKLVTKRGNPKLSYHNSKNTADIAAAKIWLNGFFVTCNFFIDQVLYGMYIRTCR